MSFDYHLILNIFNWWDIVAYFLFGFAIGLAVGVLLSNTAYQDRKTLKRWLKGGKDDLH